MSAAIIDGKAAAAELREGIKAAIADFTRKAGQAPGLRVILVGDNPASTTYVATKERTALQVGIASGVTKLPVTQVIRGSFPFCISDTVVLIIVLMFPLLALWLPGKLITSHF